MRMTFDKRVIELQRSHITKVIDILPLGHYKIPFMDKTRDVAMIIWALVLVYGADSAIESKICTYIFPLYCAYF